MMNLEIRNLTPLQGRVSESLAFSASLYVEDERAGTVESRGTGGCFFYYWTSPAQGREIEAWADARPTEHESEKLDGIIVGLIAGASL